MQHKQKAKVARCERKAQKYEGWMKKKGSESDFPPGFPNVPGQAPLPGTEGLVDANGSIVKGPFGRPTPPQQCAPQAPKEDPSKGPCAALQQQLQLSN